MSRPPLDPVSLRLFVAVVEEGTIAAAAEREHIAAAAVSRRLAELEERVGSGLLRRTNRGIAPTPAGTSLLFLARSALNELDDIVARMHDFSGGRRGSVHLLANISAIGQFLPAMLRSFRDAHPLIQIKLEQRESLDITREVAERRADLGIFTRMPHAAEVEVHRFRTDRLVLVVPDGHVLAGRSSTRFAETLDHPFVALRSGTHLNFQLLTAANEAGRVLRISIEVASYDALFLMVRAGLGIGVMPAGCAANYRPGGTALVEIDEPWAARELALCVRSRADLSPAAALLLDHLLTADAPE